MIHTENFLEITKACEDLVWNHDRSTPHQSETKGITEGAVRRAKEWTWVCESNQDWIKHDGEKRWNVIVLYGTCMIYQQMGSLRKRRYDTAIRGPIIPFGAEMFLSSNYHTRQEQASSIRLKSPERYFH